jgi:hypothetical protein
MGTSSFVVQTSMGHNLNPHFLIIFINSDNCSNVVYLPFLHIVSSKPDNLFININCFLSGNIKGEASANRSLNRLHSGSLFWQTDSGHLFRYFIRHKHLFIIFLLSENILSNKFIISFLSVIYYNLCMQSDIVLD